MRPLRLVLPLALTAALVGAAPAAATNATGAEVRALAARAANDPAALAELRRIDRVDGRPVDLRRALAGVHGGALQQRLRALVQALPTENPSAVASRAHAREILNQRRFRGESVPRPLHSILQWLGRRLRRIGHLGRHVPGGDAVLWILVGALVIGITSILGLVVVRRRGRALVSHARWSSAEAGTDPGQLERAAEEAERNGDLELALRLRFRAGLIRLGETGALPRRASLLSGEVSGRLGLPEFDRLALSFDEVVYGRRPPRSEDLDLAREAWPKVLTGARRR